MCFIVMLTMSMSMSCALTKTTLNSNDITIISIRLCPQATEAALTLNMFACDKHSATASLWICLHMEQVPTDKLFALHG